MSGTAWTDNEQDILRTMYRSGAESQNIAKALRKTNKSVESAIHRLQKSEGLARRLNQPKTAEWKDALSVSNSALIMGDVETPYHNADFVNRCIELATRWGITQLILNGDYVHFANLSLWGADFANETKPPAEIDDPDILALLETLPESKREAWEKTIAKKLGVKADDQDISAELTAVRQTTREISGAFERIYYVLGNHELRKLRMSEKIETPAELLHYIGAGEKWQAAPYYYCHLDSNGQKYRVEHPRGAGASTARDLAIQYHCHIIMGHSHRWAVQRDPSGDYWAIQAGHCVDENRLAYVMTRSAKRDAHALGAVIVRDGYPFVLCENSPWGLLMKMV